MFVEVEHSEYQGVDLIAPAEDAVDGLVRKLRLTERLAVAALQALWLASPEAYNDLLERLA